MNKEYLPFYEKDVNIIDLVKLVTWEDVKRSWIYHYPDNPVKGYDTVFEEIKKYRKRKPKTEEKLEIVSVYDDTIPEDASSYYSCSGSEYSFSFSKWRELANLPISEGTLKHYRPEDIITHFLWEITWYGSEKDSLKKGKELFSIIEDHE